MTTRMARQPTVQFTARLPAELHTWLAQRAQKNHRSANAELAAILEALRDDGPSGEGHTCTRCKTSMPANGSDLCLRCEDRRGVYWND